jgi:uncharacterized membrane protein
MRLVTWSLVAVFATGAAVIALTHGALGETRWMKASFALFLLLGFLHGMARRQLRLAQQSDSIPTASNLPGKALNRILWAMCAVVAAITWLMESKPW